MSEAHEKKDINTIQKENLELLQKSILENDEKIFSEKYTWEEISEPVFFDDVVAQESKEEVFAREKAVERHSISQKFFSSIAFLCRYVLTASFIFVILMAFTNYSAYITIAKSYLYPDAIAQSEAKMNKSIESSKIVLNNDKVVGIQEKMTLKNIEEEKENDNDNNNKEATLDIKQKKDIRDIVWDFKSEEIDLDIEIIPFVNRVVIPKIAKNIPLVDIEQGNVEDFDELNGVFMDELKWGVVRYPGSAKPWNFWNSFIFGHSSNFPWIEWDYNDVFVLLDKLEIGDEVITYYEWQKFVYRITEKKVINPNDVSVLKRDTGKKEITLMTCWPIGTTYNRLLLIGEIVNE